MMLSQPQASPLGCLLKIHVATQTLNDTLDDYSPFSSNCKEPRNPRYQMSQLLLCREDDATYTSPA